LIVQVFGSNYTLLIMMIWHVRKRTRISKCSEEDR
jgi:hypothetical protein